MEFAHDIFINGTNTNSSAYLLTPFELGLRIWVGLGLCSIATVFHTLIAISILKGKYMASRFYVFIFFISIARTMFALGHVIASIYHVLRISGVASLDISSLGCHAIQLLALVSPTLELTLLLILVTDRAVAFGAPLFYRNLGSKQAIKMCVATCLGWLFCRFLASYAGVSARRMVQCINVLAPLAPPFALFYQYFDFAVSVIILIPFLYIIFVLWWRFNRATGENVMDASVKRSMKVLPFLRLQLLMHCLFVVSSRSMKLAAAYVPSQATEQRLTAYYGMLAAADIFVNAIIFFWKYPRIWYESMRMLCGERMTRKLVQWKLLKVGSTDGGTVGGATTKVAPQPITAVHMEEEGKSDKMDDTGDKDRSGREESVHL